MRKFLKFISPLILASLIFYGCTSKGNIPSSSAVGTSGKSTASDTAGTTSSTTAAQENKQTDSQTTKQASSEKDSDTPKPITLETFNIYDINKDTLKPVISYTYPVNKDAELYAKVNAIASEVVKSYFPGLLYGTSYKKVDGKTIAVFNLIDNKPHTFEYTWYQKLQGSTGAQITYKRIVENILQRDYKGTWINGVEILYNGKTADFEHAPEIASIIYR